MPDSPIPQQIDRFQILEVLGKGTQGIVYLAEDPSLQRKVAIKAVSLRDSFQEQSTIDNLMQEARTVSQLQHNNIISIYDVGSVHSAPYLVLEYVDGETLNSLLRKRLPIKKCLSIMRDVLQGVAAAHERGIIHCDLKPANIMINTQERAKVADFGLALLAETQQQGSDGLAGTPQYMAPEYIETRQHQTVSDVFSLGLIFYQMLTGKLAVDGDDIYQLLNAIANEPIEPPSTINSEIDDWLDSLIMKALEKIPENRFRNAGEMLKAMQNSLSLDDAEKHSDGSDATVQFLLRRMSHKKDFPAFSQTISVLNRASSSDTESLATVSNAILRDISLTNKLLRIVNSAYYQRGGGKISTISRAVVMLGINPIKSLAASLMLFEHLQNKSQAQNLMDDAVTSLFSALLANDIAQNNQFKRHEEAFLCALLQQLGKLLVRFYLHEESVAIEQQVGQNGMEEETAALKVLGTSYHRLGMAVAKEWGFPEQIINSMKPYDGKAQESSDKPQEKLRQIANFSNSLSHALRLPSKQQDQAVKAIQEQYSKALKVDKKKISTLIDSAQSEMKRFARLINFNMEKSAFYKQLNKIETVEETEQSTAVETSIKANPDTMQILEQDLDSGHQMKTEKALTDGIQDITNTLTGDYTINQIMQMILETIYRALPGSRVLLALRNKTNNCIEGRSGYGDQIESLTSGFRVPLAYKADVFHIAFKNNVDIKIDNSLDDQIRDKIPDWFHKKIGSTFFMLFPIVIKHSPVAMIYIDTPDSTIISIDDNQLGLLKTLRNQAVLAIKTLN